MYPLAFARAAFSPRYTIEVAMGYCINLAAIWGNLTAEQMRASCMMAQPLLDMTLGVFDKNPVGIKIEGIRSLAALTPAFARIADRFPDSITIQYGLGKTDLSAVSPDKGRSFSNVVIALNAAEPWRNIEAAGFISRLHTKQHQRVDYRDLLTDPVIEGHQRALKIETVMKTDGADLVRFSSGEADKAPVYISAPRSGHFSTLISKVIQNYVDEGTTVYVRDLKDVALTSPNVKPFDYSEQAKTDADFLRKIHQLEGRAAHALAICQALVPAAMATAIMCEDKVPFKPVTFTAISGPANTSITKSVVNQVAEEMPEWYFRHAATDVVPLWFAGGGKQVRAGQRQVGDFMAGNPARHMQDIAMLFDYIARGSGEWARHQPFDQKAILQAMKEDDIGTVERDFLGQLLFRTEYMTDADQEVEAYLDAVLLNFKKNGLMTGALTVDGRVPKLKSIDCPVLTVDAEKDDVSSVGQTAGLHEGLSSKIERRTMLVPGKGHFWWGGETARREQFPQIMAWQEDPASSSIPRYTPDFLRQAQVIHDRNTAQAKANVTSGKPFSIQILAAA